VGGLRSRRPRNMARTLRHSEGRIGTVIADFAGRAPAYALAGRGPRVAVFERCRIGGEGAEAAAGILSPLVESGGTGPILALALGAARGRR
jgi:hypothetical protein